MWCLGVLVNVPLGVVVSWVEGRVLVGVVSIVVGPGVGVPVSVVGWLNVLVVDIVGVSRSVVADIVGRDVVVVVSSPCEVMVPVGVGDGVWDFPVLVDVDITVMNWS